MKEQWKQIKDFPNYEVSNKGRVRSWVDHKRKPREKPKILKQFIAGKYLKVHLYTETEKKRMSVSRLVGMHFVGNPKNYTQINHIDGDKLNNNANNVEWCTKSQNMQHAYDNGLKKPPKGSKNGKSKLTKSDVLTIRNAYKLDCFTYQEMADAYGVNKTCIAKIVNQKTWSHL